MANQFTQTPIAHKPDRLSETDFSDSDNSMIFDDELIAALQNRRENARARQVFEWETVRRQIFKNNSAQNLLRGAA